MKRLVKNFGIDHYTLIVPNAKEVADFHKNVLGYKLINTILVNAGSAPKGQHDMLNYVMSWSNNQNGVMVVTEGLTKESIFHKFMIKFGQGIHHIAFEIENINQVFEQLKSEGIELTSDELLRDPLTGLKQFFISSQYIGIFIELIERKSENKLTEEQGFFTQDNMSGLAQTMNSYLDSGLKEDRDIRALDETNYHSSEQLINAKKIKGIILYPQDIEKAKGFLKSVFGFAENQQGFFNPIEPDIIFIFDTNAIAKENIIPAKLIFHSEDFNQNKSVLDNLNLEYSTHEDQISLKETYSGYPITISPN